MNPKILLPVAFAATFSASLGIALGQQPAAPSTGYDMINLGVPLGGTFANAQTLSLQGYVAGYSNTKGDVAEHAVLWEINTTKDLGTLGGPSSAVLGNISGFSETATADSLGQDFCLRSTHLTCQAFTVVNQSAVALPTLGGNSAIAFGNNDSGQIVGESLTANPRCQLPGRRSAPATLLPGAGRASGGLAKWQGHRASLILRRLRRTREWQQRPRSDRRLDG